MERKVKNKSKSNDYCSFVPDLDLSICCKIHDIQYRKSSQMSRFEADRNFKKCMIEHGRPVVGWVYYVGVRLLGWLFYHKN